MRLDLEKTLSKWIGYVDNYVDRKRTANDEARQARDYYDSKQWTASEIAALHKNFQPVVTDNRIKPKVDFLLGMEAQQRTDPRAFPRNPDDEDSANAATDALRFIAENSDYDIERSQAFEYLTIEGEAAIFIGVEKHGDEFMIMPRSIEWNRYMLDPFSTDRFGRDKRWDGIVIWMDEDEAKLAFPGRGSVIDSTFDDTFDSKLAERPFDLWMDNNRRRVKVVQLFAKEQGVWTHGILTKAGWLVDPDASTFLDEDGEPDNPIVTGRAFVDSDNDSYGVVRQLISPQDELNKRRSKALHWLTARQVMVRHTGEKDVESIRRELMKPNGVIELIGDDGNIEVLDNTNMTEGQLVFMQQAQQAIDAVGANSSLLGKDDTPASGRAVQARQQGGVIELGKLFDTVRMMSKQVYRQKWNRVKQFWDAEKWIRVTDDENNVKFVQLNRPVTFREAVKERLEEMQANGTPIEEVRGLASEVGADPRFREVADEIQRVENNTGELNVDIILEEAPDVVNIRAEQFDQLVRLYQATPDPRLLKFLIQGSDLRNKDQILDELSGGGDISPQEQAAQQQQQAVEQAALQLQFEGEDAKNDKTEAEAEKIRADAQKSQVETALLLQPAAGDTGASLPA